LETIEDGNEEFPEVETGSNENTNKEDANTDAEEREDLEAAGNLDGAISIAPSGTDVDRLPSSYDDDEEETIVEKSITNAKAVTTDYSDGNVPFETETGYAT